MRKYFTGAFFVATIADSSLIFWEGNEQQKKKLKFEKKKRKKITEICFRADKLSSPQATSQCDNRNIINIGYRNIFFYQTRTTKKENKTKTETCTEKSPNIFGLLNVLITNWNKNKTKWTSDTTNHFCATENHSKLVEFVQRGRKTV